jgi:hypothetical protein
MKRDLEKLTVSKETLRDMSQGQLPDVNGGGSGACPLLCPTTSIPTDLTGGQKS